MIKEIVKDREQLLKPCVEVLEGDMIAEITHNLIDTADYHAEHGEVGCAGLSANQIGYDKRIFVINLGGKFIPFINPVLLDNKKKWGMVSKTEGCLSLPGISRKVSRYKRIRLAFNDFRNGARVEFNFKGHAARVIQHELDHLDGKLI